MPWADFQRAEVKRTVNRLREVWKRNPWAPGRTIDLLDHEMVFQGDILHWHGCAPLPPAVLDWLRWRFRRLQVDRSKPEDWATLLRDELPRRVRDAGPMPQGWTDQSTGSATWQIDSATSKRSRPDVARAKRQDHATDTLTMPTKPPDVDASEVARIVSSSSELLRPLLPLCFDQDERDALVAALVAYVQVPSSENRARWLQVISQLRKR